MHSTASRVDFFYGTAMLTADFDADDLEVTGKIHDIVAGGVVGVTPDIYLDLMTEGTANIDRQDATFDGRARMGAERISDTDGQAYYPYEGTWAGAFYNAEKENDPATAAANELENAPGAAAGTFGVESTAPGATESYVGAFGAHKQ